MPFPQDRPRRAVHVRTCTPTEMPVHATTDLSSNDAFLDKDGNAITSQAARDPAFGNLPGVSSGNPPGNLPGNESGSEVAAATPTPLDDHRAEPDDSCPAAAAKINPFDDIFAVFDD